MEKFAVDLEKVLDEFEFNEEREERVPSSVINNQSLSYICQTAPVRPGNYRRPSFEPINLADADFAASTQSPSTRFGAVTSSKHVALPPAAAAAATIDSSSSATSKTQPTLINSNWRAPSGERAKHEEKPDLIDHSDKVKQVTADVSSRLPDVTTLSSSNNAFVDVVASPASHNRFVDSTASYNNTYTDDSTLSSTKNSFVDGNSLSTSDNKFIDSTTLSSSNNPFDDSTKFSSTDNKFIDSTISSSTNNTLFVDVNTLSTSNNAFVDSTTLSSSNNAFVGEESAAVINPVFDLIDDNSVHPCNNINNSAVNINNFNNKVNSSFVVDKLVTDDYSSVVETDDNSLNNEVIRQKVGYCTDDSLSTNRIPSDVTDCAAKLDNNNGDEYVSDPSGVEISLVEESELVEDREEKKEGENKEGNRKEELSHIEGERQICEGEVSVECSNVSKEPVGVIEEDASNLYKNEPVEEKTHLIVESVVSNIQSVEEIEVKVSLQSVDDIDLPTGSDSSKFDKQPETVSSNFEIDEQLETGSSKCEISEQPETDSSELEAVKHPEPLVGFKPFSEPNEDDEELDKYLAELEILEKEEKELEEQQGLSEVEETVKQDSIQEDSEELSTGSGSDSDETAELHDIIEPPQQKARELVASGLISRSKESISRSLSDFIEKDISVDVKEESSREFQVAVDRQNAALLDYYNSNSPVECAGNGGRLNSVSCASGSSTDLKPLECQVGVAVEQTKSKSLECQVGGEESGENRKEAESSGKLLECKVAVRRTKNSSTIEKEGNVDSVIAHTASEINKETDSVIGQKVESDSVSTQKLGADSVITQKLDSAIGQKQESDSVITESESSSLDSSEYESGMGNTSEKASGSLATDNVDNVASTSSSRHPASVGDESWSSSSEDVTASKCDNGRLTSTPKCDNGKMTTTTKCDDGRLAEPRAAGEMADDAADKPSRPNFLELPARITMDNSAVTSPTPSATPSIEESEDGSTVECGAGARQTAPLASEAGDEQLGRVKPVWVPDEEAPNCMQCHLKFGLIKRRHHCRACGKVLCSKCCSMKAKLLFMDGEEARVCQRCYSILERDGSTDGARSPLGRQPNPNNPMEYCSTIPPLQQVAGSLPQSPPSVLVPVGVLKREGRAKSDVTKQVMFSDGIRPGGDLTELDGSTETKLPFRRPGRMMKRVGTPPGGHSSRTMRRPMDPVTGSFIPGEGEKSLPPTVVKSHGETIYTEFENTAISPNQPPLKFAINRNLFVHVKRVLLECCVNRDCWCITSEGLACVGQDEIILVLECLPDETVPPKDVFLLINSLYEDASKGNTVSELSFSPAFSNNLLGSKDHGGFLYIRPTYQCTAQLILPNPPYLVALLIHRWETPWARLFPIRLELRLGAEFRYYPCPLVSVRHRPSLYTDIGHTIISLLADFRLYNYTLPVVRGLVVHMEDRQTTILIPRNRYDQVLRALNNSNDSVLPFGANFSLAADSHLVCMQSMEDENTYHTQAINIQNKPRKVTGASFVVFNGALKPSSVGGGAGAGGVAGGGATVSGKSSIVEDGLMVQVSADTMVALRGALRDMRDYTIGCGPHAEETVLVRWTQDDCNFNIGVKSMIDGRPLDGVPSMRVHSGIDFSGNLRIIRWTEVFILQSEERNSSGSSGGGGKGAAGAAGDPVDISRLSESLAQATCLALVPFLDLLAAASLTAVALRANIHPDNVGYEAGSNGERLPPLYMKTLDDELVAVLHDAAQAAQDAPPAVLELVFRVMES